MIGFIAKYSHDFSIIFSYLVRYILVEFTLSEKKIMIASPQKAILDFFYINSFNDTEKDMEYLRLNEPELKKI